VPSRIRYLLGAALILVSVGLFVVLTNRPIVYPSLPPGKWHLEAAAVDDKAIALLGSYPGKPFDVIPAPHEPYPYDLRDPFPNLTLFIRRWFPSYVPIKTREEIPETPLQIVVKQKLPEALYAAVITNNSESLTLPLMKQAEGIYATPPFILLTGDKKLTDYKGMKVEMWNGPSPNFDMEVKKIVVDKP